MVEVVEICDGEIGIELGAEKGNVNREGCIAPEADVKWRFEGCRVKGGVVCEGQSVQIGVPVPLILVHVRRYERTYCLVPTLR